VNKPVPITANGCGKIQRKMLLKPIDDVFANLVPLVLIQKPSGKY